MSLAGLNINDYTDSKSLQAVCNAIPFLTGMVHNMPTPTITKMTESVITAVIGAAVLGFLGVVWILFTDTLPSIKSDNALMLQIAATNSKNIAEIRLDFRTKFADEINNLDSKIDKKTEERFKESDYVNREKAQQEQINSIHTSLKRIEMKLNLPN